MRLSLTSIIAVLLLTATAAQAENWVVVVDEEIGASVDKDSIRRGSDGLVYFTVRYSEKSDAAVNCETATAYTIKLYAMDGYNYPNWRNEGRPIVPGSVGDGVYKYVCANAS
ncbi:MAG: hypothetical protein KBA31_14265 [Alphaproteobacteria bacterium]|nr:hypothetical protein [Alphaproteobacteria bacterium]